MIIQDPESKKSKNNKPQPKTIKKGSELHTKMMSMEMVAKKDHDPNHWER
jgi:hypothetical protein